MVDLIKLVTDMNYLQKAAQVQRPAVAREDSDPSKHSRRSSRKLLTLQTARSPKEPLKFVGANRIQRMSSGRGTKAMNIFKREAITLRTLTHPKIAPELS